ncbi:MAG: GNAT family N-acetyltransferase [Candidatus Magasanikbacteria bacterium]|nr:GNAT family N-acetyltransferase [Candidatus Magasanikbacteria bacterium]
MVVRYRPKGLKKSLLDLRRLFLFKKKEEKKMTEIIDMNRLARFVSGLKPSAHVAILFTGDRLACCDEAVTLRVGCEIVGVATIAPEGEEYTGQPTIVALYIEPGYRRRGHGTTLMKSALERCRERGFETVRVDVMSDHVMKIIRSLPAELATILDVHDMGAMMDSFRG